MITHSVPSATFDALASGGGDTLGVLRAGQRSKRLLLLHELISMTRRQAPGLFADARADESYAVLAEAQRRDPHSVDTVLAHPHVGGWAMHCLRSLATRGDIEPVDFGHLGGVAAAGALRAGQPFEVTTHVRDGAVMLPTFGRTRLPVAPGWCRIRAGPGSTGFELSTADTSVEVSFGPPERRAGATTWLPLRQLRSAAAGVAFDVDLDDLDPYRGCGHLPTADRLGDDEVDAWQTTLDEGWSLLAHEHPESAAAVSSGIVSIVPLVPEVGLDLSGSCHETVGAVAMTAPRDGLTLVLALVHEFQHTKLSALLDLVRMLDRFSDEMFYAPWRPDPRPARGLLQGAYAYLGLTGFWDVHRRRHTARGSVDAALAHFKFALDREQVGQALGALARSGQLRPPGVRFVAGMRRRLSELERLPVPRTPRSLAHLVCLDHATSWRLRNLQPDPEQIGEGASAWLSGRSCPWTGSPKTTLHDGGGTLASEARLDAVRERLRGNDHRRGPTQRASPADILLLSGQPERAVARYCAQLADAPHDLASWAGLALARRRLPSGASWALTRCPEAVYALHDAIRQRCGSAPDAEDLAAWVARSAADER